MNVEVILFQKETSDYLIKYRRGKKSGEFELLLKSKSAGAHFAIHKRYNLLDDSGKVLSSQPIDRTAAEFIINNFEKRGDTASFDIYESDLALGQLLPREPAFINPEDVRHKLTLSETSYTSTGEKLAHHWPIFDKYKNTGHASIVRATMTLHQLCSSHCHYCSTIARNKRDSITLDEAKDFINNLYDEQAAFNRKNFSQYNDEYLKLTGTDIRLRGLILSGGGQPNLWPHFEEFVYWLSEKDIDLGLITNGFPKKVSEDVYKKFKWVRISITPEDASPHYPNQKFNLQYIPQVLLGNPDITVGYSYVYGPWTDADVLNRIVEAVEDNGFDYCRLLTDCNLSRSSQLKAHQALAERLFELGIVNQDGMPLKKIFHQLKYHGEESEAKEIWDSGQCFLQIYNVFWDTTGHEDAGESFCYACDSITVLSEEHSDASLKVSERRFNHEKWGLVSNKQIKELYEKPVKSYFDPRKVCNACLFMKNNRVVKDLVSNVDFQNITLKQDIEHVNFP